MGAIGRTDALLYGAIALALVGGAIAIQRSLRPRLLELPTPPPGSALPAPAPPPIPGVPRMAEHLVGDPVPLETGARYLAAIVVSGPLSLLASTSKVADEARSLGFSAVAVTKTPPPNRPPLPDADYFVEGTFAEPRAAIARKHAGGRVTVVDAWRLG